MAGSFKHVTTIDGKLVDYDDFIQLIENSGDAYEAIEEMYGMIWWLAGGRSSLKSQEEWVDLARTHYKDGIDQSPGVNP